jgi:heme exporter protein B
MIGSLLRREWQILRRAKGAVINPMAFLFLSATLFAIAAPALVIQQTSQGASAAGILWTLVLLTQLLALDGMYRRDFDSGLLEQLLVTAQVPFVAVLSRIFMQWLSTGFIIVLASPLLAVLLGLSVETLPAMALASASWYSCIEPAWQYRCKCDGRFQPWRSDTGFAGVAAVSADTDIRRRLSGSRPSRA